MPELPEVETIVRAFGPKLAGRRITAFRSLWAKNTLPSLAAVRSAIVGRTIRAVTRRAKFIVFELDDDSRLFVHLRMSGRFEWAETALRDGRDSHRHIRAIWTLDDGNRLLFCDARKFGRIIHAKRPEDVTGELGPEPLERSFTAERLKAILRRRSRLLKPLLLDQTVIAGLGNIYTDEALFRAGLHPLQKSDCLSQEEVRRLHTAIRHVLRLAIRQKGTQFDWVYPGGRMQERLFVYGRAGEPCRQCETPIVALRVSQRGTHICPDCQPREGPARTRRSARSSSR